MTEKKWISPQKFNKVYAVYQMVPGEEKGYRRMMNA